MRRAPSTTMAPSADSNRAAASPSPLLAPVITTTLPAILLLTSSPSDCPIQAKRLACPGYFWTCAQRPSCRSLPLPPLQVYPIRIR